VLELSLDNENVSLAAELTLALLLFSDASRIDTTALRSSFALPARLLGIGLPLTVGLGTVMTASILTDLSWSEAALVAAILAPTDAALGQAVVANRRVPVLVRQSLNVESGLNDGLVVPAVALFALLVEGADLDSPTAVALEALQEIGIGVVVGCLAGGLIATLTRWAARHRWADADGVRVATFGGAVAGFAGSIWLGGNGFIAAFVAGLVLHIIAGERADDQAKLAEDAGQIGAAATFVIFGALMVAPSFEVLTWAVAACVLGALTIGRMVPVAIALAGTGLRWPTKTFIGWFGPRGLASMLFGLLVLADREGPVDELFAIVTLAICGSVVLHGLSAGPGAQSFARWFDSHTDTSEMMESVPMPELQLRGGRHS